MKKINFLMTICVILFGFTLNSQNVAISAESGSFSFTTNTELTNSIILGSAGVNSAGATSATQNTGLGLLALDNLKFGDKNTAIGYKAGSGIGGANGQGAGGADSGTGNTLVGNAAGYQIGVVNITPLLEIKLLLISLVEISIRTLGQELEEDQAQELPKIELR